jgi:hypothetical protein
VKTSDLELDRATVEERQYEEYVKFDVLQEESENLEDIVAPMLGAQRGRGEPNSRPQPLHKYMQLNI